MGEDRDATDRPFLILSIDGGGYRGAYAAHILKRIEEEWAPDWRSLFGMFAGTSTGSILAAGLACGIPAEKLARVYEEHGSEIFRRRLRSRFDVLKILTSRYSNRALRSRLDEEFKDVTLGEVPVPLIIPAVDIGKGCVHVFKSKFKAGFVRDPGVRVVDAVLASCSAPTYFDPIELGRTYQLADGGLWANNPSLVASIDAHYRLQVSLAAIRVLSIGTGNSKAYYPRRGSWWRDYLFRSWQGWGLATRWRGSKLLDLILNLQADTAHNMLCLLFREDPQDPASVLRLTFESDLALPLDSTRKHPDWVSIADHTFTHNADRIKAFLGL